MDAKARVQDWQIIVCVSSARAGERSQPVMTVPTVTVQVSPLGVSDNLISASLAIEPSVLNL